MLHRHPPPQSERINDYYQRRHLDGSITCRFGYDKPLRSHTTIDHDGRVQYRRRHIGDENVVPHCLPLLLLFQCHINVEAAFFAHLFQYMFKYIHKGMLSLPVPF